MSSNTEEIIRIITESRGFVIPWQAFLAKQDPEFVDLLWRIQNRKGVLPRKYKELIYIALDASQKYAVGLRNHVKEALQAGATKEEIIEVIQLVSFVSGVPTLNTSTKILDEVLGDT